MASDGRGGSDAASVTISHTQPPSHTSNEDVKQPTKTVRYVKMESATCPIRLRVVVIAGFEPVEGVTKCFG